MWLMVGFEILFFVFCDLGQLVVIQMLWQPMRKGKQFVSKGSEFRSMFDTPSIPSSEQNREGDM